MLLPQPLNHRDLHLPLHPHSSPGGSPLRYHEVAESEPVSNPNSNSNSNSIKTDDHNMEEIALIDENPFGKGETSSRVRIGHKFLTPEVVLASPRSR